MRDKLIELIQNAVGGCARHWAELIADALIANGVAFADGNNVGGKPMTNGDRIRAMSDEELADFLGWRSLCGHIQIDHYEVCETRGVCGGCVLNWLKQEADHDTD